MIIKVYNGTTLISGLDQFADENGYLLGCLTTTGPHSFDPGNKVVIKVYPPGAKTASASYVSRVPQLKIQKVIKQEATWVGVGTPGRRISGLVLHSHMENGQIIYTKIGRSGYVGSDGQWRLAFNDNLPPSDVDLSSQGGGYGVKSFTGGDSFWLSVHDSANISYELLGAYVPAVSCHLGGNSCLYIGMALTPINLIVEQGGVKHLVQGPTGTGAFTYVYFPDGLRLQSGDKVAATGAAPLVMPEITVQLDRNTGVISGVGPANRWLHFQMWNIVNRAYTYFSIPTDKNKTYSYTTTNFLKKGSAYRVTIYYFNPITGNGVSYSVINEDN